MTSLSSSSS